MLEFGNKNSQQIPFRYSFSFGRPHQLWHDKSACNFIFATILPLQNYTYISHVANRLKQVKSKVCPVNYNPLEIRTNLAFPAVAYPKLLQCWQRWRPRTVKNIGNIDSWYLFYFILQWPCFLLSLVLCRKWQIIINLKHVPFRNWKI
jgi:hypothetical protein